MTAFRPVTDESPPIFIFGVLGRSGTNFLSDLLCLHPDCAPAHPLDENFFHFFADQLEHYAHRTAGKWHPDWGLSEDGPDRLLASLGRGLLGYLDETADAGRTGRRLVTKTPSVKNLSLFPRLFPGAPAIVIVRDGRAVVESIVRSFGREYETPIRNWAWATRLILETTSGGPSPETPFVVVRYEDLVTDPDPQLRRIFEFVGLDADSFDFDGVRDLPVRGSSTFRGDRDDVNWRPVERSDEFQPLRRWRDWTPARHDRFNWLAGRELEALGYERVGPAAGLPHAMRNRLKDLTWRLRSR